MTQRTLSITTPNVGERIARDRDDVGVVARRDASERALHPEDRRAVRGGGGEHLGRRHADLREPAELARVLAEHDVHGVRAHAHLDAGFVRAARRRDVEQSERVEPGRLLRRVVIGFAVLRVVPVVIDRRDVEDPVAGHARERRVVEVDRVLERRRAGAHGVAAAVGPVRVNRDALAEGFRRVDRGLHLLVGERLVPGDVGAACPSIRTS